MLLGVVCLGVERLLPVLTLYLSGIGMMLRGNCGVGILKVNIYLRGKKMNDLEAVYFNRAGLAKISLVLTLGLPVSVYIVFFTDVSGIGRVFSFGAVLMVPFLLFSLYARLFFCVRRQNI